MTLKSIIQENALVISVLISVLVVFILTLTLDITIGMSVLLYFVVIAIAYMGIKTIGENNE